MIRNRKRHTLLALSTAAAGLALATPLALAADGTWLGSFAGSDFSWANGANWNSAVVPGSTNGTAGASTDTAIFNQSGGGGTEVLVDPGRNIKNITFDIQTTGSGQTIGVTTSANPLYLSAGALVQITAACNAATSPAFNSPIVLLGNATFRDLSTTSSAGLKVNTSVTSAAAGPVTLTLDGTAASGVLTSNSSWTAVITDGPGSPVGIFKDGTSEYDLRAAAGPNTYSGDTVLNAGAIRFNSTGALSANSNYIVNQGATFRPSIGGTIKSMTANSCIGYTAPGETTPRSTLTESGNAIVSMASNSGPALTMNMATQTNAGSLGVPTSLTGTVAGQGGVKLTVSDSTAQISYGKNIDLGTVDRPFEIAHSAANGTAGTPDLQLNGVISGSGGIVKTGPGDLKFNNAANTFTGQLDVQAGTVRFNTANALVGNGGVLPPLKVSGGDINVQGLQQTVGAVTVTKGTITASSSTGMITAPSYALNVAGGDTATITAALTDSGGASTLTKTGAGSASMTRTNTYTGLTTVNGGTLTVTKPAFVTIQTGPAGADIKTGQLVVDYTGDSDPAPTIQGILTAAYPGFSTGPLRNSNANTSIALGWLDDTANSHVRIASTYYGDANLSGSVDTIDFSTLASNFSKTGQTWGNGDFDYSGTVDTIDFSLLAANFGKAPVLAPGGESSLGGLVPEPASAGVLGIISASLLARRRHRA